MCSSGNPPVSFAVSLCMLSCFFPSCFVHNFLKFLSILEIVNLNSLVGLTFSLPPGCSPPFDVSPYAGHSALFLCTLWDFGYWKGLVSPVMAVTLGSRGWLYSLALGSPLTSCLWFCLSFHSLLHAELSSLRWKPRSPQSLYAFIFPNTWGWLCSLPITQALSNALVSGEGRGTLFLAFSLWLQMSFCDHLTFWSPDSIFNNTCHFPALEGFLMR